MPRAMAGSKILFSWTLVKESDGTNPDLTSGAATMRYRYGTAGTVTDTAVSNSLDTTGLVQLAITVSAGVLEYQFYGTDTASDPWYTDIFTEEVESSLPAP